MYFCGRDPRDAFLSIVDHRHNLSQKTMEDVRHRGNMPADFAFAGSANEMFPIWLTTGQQPWMGDGFPSGSVLYLSATYWRFRHLPNITFMHYTDLSANRETEMRRLAAALGITVDESKWPSLVEAAGFPMMKAHASENAPGAHLGEWANDADFFRKARRGEWHTALSAENLALYEKISTERLEPDLKRWLEGGRTACDPKT